MSTTINAECDKDVVYIGQFPDPKIDVTISSVKEPWLRPFVCPVCGGRGRMPYGFYNSWASSTTCNMPETCRSCQGTGIVWR